MSILEVKHLEKIYEGKVAYKALNNIHFSVEKGEFVGIMGPSGSGKTTLLNVIALQRVKFSLMGKTPTL